MRPCAPLHAAPRGWLPFIVALAAASIAACGDDESAETSSGGGGGTSTSSTTDASGTDASSGATDAASTSTGTDGTGGSGGNAPTERQLDQVATLERYVDETADGTAWSEPTDREALKASGRAEILEGDGSDGVFFQAMHHVHLAMPQGHQTLSRTEACDTPDMFLAGWSRFGVCGRPNGDAIVVTFAQGDNALDLEVGDTVIAAGGEEGAAMLEAAIDRPVCGSLPVSDSGLRTMAAASFFGSVADGTTLSIRPAGGGAVREVEVPSGALDFISCQDPLGRDIDFNADAYVRDDGVAVLRLPRFYPIDAVLPDNPTSEQVEAFIEAFRASVLAAFDEVREEPLLVIDARSNFGGITQVGLDIVSGMPTAESTAISYCTARIAGTDPPAFDDVRYAEYAVEPGGPFAYDGEVVVLVDGLDYSAADYFPYAIRKATSTLLVGSASAGAYGGPGPLDLLEGPPEMAFNVDLNRCVDADTDEPLEGVAVVPDVVVEYDPDDLAEGIDTVLEAGVALLLAD